jgi:hypothetical protein
MPRNKLNPFGQEIPLSVVVKYFSIHLETSLTERAYNNDMKSKALPHVVGSRPSLNVGQLIENSKLDYTND